ncbi:MAG: hypothetical protein WAM81_10735 [Acidimicrobiia bacterium]
MIRISGIVRLPDDLDSGITAVVQVLNDQIRLRTGRTDLGNWPIGDIEIRRISAREFQFVIGDEVINFLPSSPDFFASLQFVEATETTEVKRRKKQRSSQPPAAPTPPQPKEAAPPSPPEPPPPADETIELDLTDEKVGALIRQRLVTRSRHLGATTRDQLRQTGIWPLDRLRELGPDDSVPSNHIHTYGVSTIQAGLIRRVCSECGHVSFLPKENG